MLPKPNPVGDVAREYNYKNGDYSPHSGAAETWVADVIGAITLKDLSGAPLQLSRI